MSHSKVTLSPATLDASLESGVSTYVGSELALFAHAKNWKSYYKSLLMEFLGVDVLEVGAGLGETAGILCDGKQRQWLCVEPDVQMARVIDEKIASDALPKCCRSFTGTLRDLPESEMFDSIIYIDVLEHIEYDALECNLAMRHLRPGGYIIVLSPAHNFLYSPFDEAIGHFRRYTRKSLSAIIPPTLLEVELCYLDSIGFLASLANRLLLRQSMPTKNQIEFWDTKIIPISKVVDRMIGFRFGKSVVGIWRKI